MNSWTVQPSWLALLCTCAYSCGSVLTRPGFVVAVYCQFLLLLRLFPRFFSSLKYNWKGMRMLFEIGKVIGCAVTRLAFFFFFLIYVGCPGQLTRTTTIPHGPLDILQAQEQVRHRGGDRHAHRGSNPGRGRNKLHDWPQQLDLQAPDLLLLDK